MKKFVKLITIILIIGLISSFFYLVTFTDSNNCNFVLKTYGYSNDQETNNSGNEDNNQDDNDSGNGNIETKHYVFIEDGTANWCSNCPKAGERLKELYESRDYNFYYVSMITDKNRIAEKRMKEDYNIYGYPTIIIDGGYRVKIGSSITKEEYADAIKDAEKRNVPKININVSAEFINTSNELETNVYLENEESVNYTGHLRVYLTEIISRWDEYNKKPYHFGFIDFIIDKNVSITSKGNMTFTDKRNISEFEVTDLVPEELMIFAVIFNSVSVKADSFPDGPEGEFNAHYADGVDATLVILGGNLPPELGINLPEYGKLHFFGKPILQTLNKKTILIFKSTINVSAIDESGIEKVEFYIDGKLISSDNEPPYEYSFKKIKNIKRIIKKHTITVIAYDIEGKSRSTSIDIIAFFL